MNKSNSIFCDINQIRNIDAVVALGLCDFASSKVAADAAHVATDAAHVASDAAHVAADVTHVAPDVTHVATDVTHVASDVTHVASDAGMHPVCLFAINKMETNMI